MDRTAEFRRLAGAPGAAADAGSNNPTSFIVAALEQRRRLARLRRGDGVGPPDASAIQACRDEMAQLESLAGDLRDLPAGPGGKQQPRDLEAHRRGLVGALYEELKDLAATVQTAQVNEMQREAEVASLFMASPQDDGRLPALPSPPSTMPALGGASSSAGHVQLDNVALDDERLRTEEQNLLMTFRTDLDQIQQTQAKVEEVALLVGQFTMKVEEQHEVVEEIQQLAVESTELIEGAEKHLKKAVENSNSYRFYVVCWFLGAGMALLIHDFLDARYSYI